MPKTGALSITTPSDREIRFTRGFDAPRQLVWDCHTKPDLMKRWLFGPAGWSLAVCDIDLRAGGTYRWVWRKAGVPDMGLGGVFREVVNGLRSARRDRRALCRWLHRSQCWQRRSRA